MSLQRAFESFVKSISYKTVSASTSFEGMFESFVKSISYKTFPAGTNEIFSLRALLNQ